MALFIVTPNEMALSISKRARDKRLLFNLTQKSLSERSGVSFGVIKKFERTGKISLESLLKLALTLASLEDFVRLFEPSPPEQFSSLDALLEDKKQKRKRGRL